MAISWPAGYSTPSYPSPTDMILNLLMLLAPAAGLAGYWAPELFSPMGPAIVPLLMVVMLSMGLTLKPADFLGLRGARSALFAGVALQFLVMPLSALAISRIMNLGSELMVGMVLVGSVAGGTASNVMSYLARGNVALSITMTATSTLMSIIATPLLLQLLAGSVVQVPAWEMLKTLLYIILLPVGLGLVLRQVLLHAIEKIQPALPLLAVFVIALIIACVVALNADNLASVGLTVMLAALVHNVVGLLLGYLAARALGFDAAICRTVAIEVGMQNSGLATALALKFFSPITALPGAAFSVWLNITGAIFANLSLRLDRKSHGANA
ncbi:MAG: bile acid:sodium symporter family protein [Pseudomonadota bacterium]